MSAALQYYYATLLVYFGVNLIAGWSLNLQFGVTGILNFSFIIFQAIGAYVAGVTTLGPSSASGGYQQYILGSSLPWPLPILLAGVAGAALAFIVGSFALRPIGRDFQAMVMLIVAVIATTVVSSQQNWFDGSNGLAAIPKPMQDALGLGLVNYGWFYVGLTAVICAITYFVVHRITSSPYGRRLRSLRENPLSAASLGVNVRAETMTVFVIGGAIAAVSGAVLVQFIGAWAPSGWEYTETFLYLAAIVVGGVGNNLGVAVGVAVVWTGILQAVQYLPNIGTGTLIGALQWMLVGVLIVAFLWLRPKGLVPERRRRYGPAPIGIPVGGEAMSVVAKVVIKPDAKTASAVDERDQKFLEVSDLRWSVGGIRAVDGVSFSIAEGEITGLIGPNGAGKSTVLNLISGIERPDSGSISYRGDDISGEASYRLARRKIIRTFQLSSEFGHMTVLENLMMAAPGQRGARLTGAMRGKHYWRNEEAEVLERARLLLARFKLGEAGDNYAENLSGGQKRLLEIARALMSEPEVLLLDEPLAGVNPTLARGVEEHLIALREEGLTMLMVEHELGAIERCTDSVIVMAQGRVLATGQMDELRNNREVIDAYLVG